MKKFIVIFVFVGALLVLPKAFGVADGTDNMPSTSTPTGTNVQSSDGTIWLIAGSVRLPYPDMATFKSYRYNDLSLVKPATEEDLGLPAGDAIAPHDGRVYCTTIGKFKGSCALVSQGTLFIFTSKEVVYANGFIMPVPESINLDHVPQAGVISDNQGAHKPGVFINDNDLVRLVTEDGLLDVPDTSTFFSWGYSFVDIVPANGSDQGLKVTGELKKRLPGQLNPLVSKLRDVGGHVEKAPILKTKDQELLTKGAELIAGLQLPQSRVIKSANNPTAYFITTRGYKKPITSAAILNSYGIGFADIQIVDNAMLDQFLPIKCVTVEGSADIYEWSPEGKRKLHATQVQIRCPYPELILEINQFEFKNTKTLIY